MPATASRRRGANKATKAAATNSSPGSATRTAFSFASVIVVALNVAVVVLVPLWPEEWWLTQRQCPPGTAAVPVHPTTTTTVTTMLRPTSTTTTTSSSTSTVQPAASPILPTVQDIAFDDDSLGFSASGQQQQDRWSSLGALNPSSLRILPDAKVEAAARASPCWLAFGLSSVHRTKADYLAFTLSHLFDALGDSNEATIVVHLADFDTNWVAAESKWLLSGFADEVEAARLHVIHAPERLYNVKQVAFSKLTLAFFTLAELNGLYRKREGFRRGNHQTFISVTGSYILYWCSSRSSEQHRRWVIGSAEKVNLAGDADCPAVAQAPRDREALDPNVKGWEEFQAGRWQPSIANAGVASFTVDADEPLKFGDAPERQRWRSKQNLDYAFLMWYSSGLSQYYMQLEDDVQVMPNFLQTVHKYVEMRVQSSPWVMIAFSKLGFIGKFLNSSDIRSLGQFLHVFHDEAPCDWLVWVWIDIWSPEPVTPEIVQDLEKEWGLRQAFKSNPATKLPASMRNDVALFYKTPGDSPLFLSAAKPLDNWKPQRFYTDRSKQPGQSPINPPGNIRTTMKQFSHYSVEHAYPPGEPSWFWTSDTCWPREPKDPKECTPSSKFVELSFATPVHLREVKVVFGSPGHEKDYMRSGSLQTSNHLLNSAIPAEGCVDYKELRSVTMSIVKWSTDVALPNVRCIKLVLTAAQEEWIAVQEISIVRNVVSDAGSLQSLRYPIPLATSSTTTSSLQMTSSSVAGQNTDAQVRRADDTIGAVVEDPSPANSDSPDGVADAAAPLVALLATIAGLSAGFAGWTCVSAGRRFCSAGVQTVGEFTCWTLSFVLLLDTLLLLLLSPPWPPAGLVSKQNAAQESSCVPIRALRGPTLKSQVTVRPADELVTALPAALTTSVQPTTTSTTAKSRAAWLAWDASVPAVAGRPVDRNALVPPIHRLDVNELQVEGLWSRSSLKKKWLVLGMLVNTESGSPAVIAQEVKRIVDAGKDMVVLLLHIPGDGVPGSKQRASVINQLRKDLASQIEAGQLRAISTPRDFYLKPPARRENIEYAMMLLAGSRLGSFYLQIEPHTEVAPIFLTSLSSYCNLLETQGIPGVKESQATWNMVSLTQVGFHRKLMRTTVLYRFADLLVMFPDVSADVLLWDWLDITGNKTAPKACKIAMDASKRRRPDVLLQYHRSEALIEHVGDSSSLAGKVQRIKDEYFKSHALGNNLFDNPVARLRSNLVNGNAIQDVYGITSIGLTMAKMRSMGWKSIGPLAPPNGEAEAFFEVLFQEPVDLVIFNLQMGGHLAPPKKNQKAEADPEFDHVLDDATLQIGRQPVDGTFSHCRVYENVDRISGRELFWRRPSSRPLKGVSCVKVSISKPQKTPLVIRSISVRSAKGLHAIRQPASRGVPLPQGSQPVAVTTTSTTTSLVTTSSGESLEDRMRREHLERRLAVDRWAERHFAWALTASLAFGSGALAGVLGCFASRLYGAGAASGRRIRPSPP